MQQDHHTFTKPITFEERFHYDPETGNFYENTIHRVNGVSTLERVDAKVRKNRQTGYLMITWQKKQQFVHRLAWWLMTGSPADGAVYHINGDKTDNRWCNLTDRMSRPVKRYQAQIRHDGRVISLGYFITKAEAEAAKTFFKNLQNNA